ncbi:MAG TPA: ATP-binding protein [Candidatus Saccharimonadales bacterium]|nr:ATP-binding protein [Candidatus Saccharimonadales bacterium]
MKTLSIAKPLVILVVGLPGAGKSYFAKQFSDTFSVPLISNNQIRGELFEKPQFSADENKIVERIQDLMLQQLLKTKGSVLVDDGMVTRQDRQKLVQIAKKSGFDVLTVWVQTNPDMAKMRATKNPNKTPDYNVIPEAHFNTIQKKFAPPTEDYIVISGMHTYTTQARTVLRKLAATHTGKVEQSKTSDLAKSRATKPPTRGIIIR